MRNQWIVYVTQRERRPAWSLPFLPQRGRQFTVEHCATVEQATRTAQRARPGWTVVAALASLA